MEIRLFSSMKVETSKGGNCLENDVDSGITNLIKPISSKLIFST